MAKWGKKKSTVPEGYSFDDQEMAKPWHEQLSRDEIQRIWDQANAKPGDTVTVYGAGGTSRSLTVPTGQGGAGGSYQPVNAAGNPVIRTQVAGTPITAGYMASGVIGTPISATPMPDPLQAVIDQRVEARFEALIKEQSITIAALQEQIDELWAELRGE